MIQLGRANPVLGETKRPELIGDFRWLVGDIVFLMPTTFVIHF